MLKTWGVCVITVALAIFFAVLSAVPLASQGVDTPADQFASARAMEDVRAIAAKPHPTGSVENKVVRDYLKKRLSDMGLEVSESESVMTGRPLERLNAWSGESKTEQTIVNIIGVLPGTDRSQKALLLMAHHDTVWGSPGAADDTAGIASILEIIRAVKTDGSKARDLIVLFTDAEELGLNGAKDFFQNHPLRDKVGAVINFEARGGGGTANMFQTSAENGHAAKLYARSVSDPSTSSLSVFVYNLLPNDTDLTPALEKDYVAYNIANLGDAEFYHSPKITADVLSERTLQHLGSQGLDLSRALLSGDPFPEKSPDRVFFDLFGLLTLIYAPFWGWIFIALAALLLVQPVRRQFALKPILLAALRMVGFMGVGAVVLYVINRLSGAGAAADYYDRLAAISALEAVALALSLALFFMFFGARKASALDQLGYALPLFLLAILGQVLAPTATYFIPLALLLTAAASWSLTRWPQLVTPKGVAVIGLGVVLGYMLGLGHLLMLGIGPDMLSVAVLPAAIGAFAVMPVYAGLPRRNRKIAVMALGALATLIALYIRFDPMAATVPLY